MYQISSAWKQMRMDTRKKHGKKLQNKVGWFNYPEEYGGVGLEYQDLTILLKKWDDICFQAHIFMLF